MHKTAYITSDKDILLGKPTIRGTRISVELIIELHLQGWSHLMILESYPSLTREQLAAVYEYHASNKLR